MGTSAGQKQSGPAPELIRGASGVRLVSVPLRSQEPCLLGDPSLQHSAQTYWSCLSTKRTWQPCLGSWHPDWSAPACYISQGLAQSRGSSLSQPRGGAGTLAFAKAVGGQPPQLYGAGILSLTPFSLKGTAHRRVQAGHGNTVHAPAIATALQLVPPPPSASHWRSYCPWPSPLYRVRLWRLGSECNL